MNPSSGHRFSLFLLELIVSLCLFAVCAAVCVTLLVRARGMSEESARLTDAVYLAQSAAELLRAGGAPEARQGDYVLRIDRSGGDGVSEADIAVTLEGETLYTLTVTWPKGVAQP